MSLMLYHRRCSRDDSGRNRERERVPAEREEDVDADADAEEETEAVTTVNAEGDEEFHVSFDSTAKAETVTYKGTFVQNWTAPLDLSVLSARFQYWPPSQLYTPGPKLPDTASNNPTSSFSLPSSPRISSNALLATPTGMVEAT